MKLETTLIEKIFIPVTSTIIVSGIVAIINIHTKLEVVEAKVSINSTRITKIFDRLDQIMDGQKEILKMLVEWERHDPN